MNNNTHILRNGSVEIKNSTKLYAKIALFLIPSSLIHTFRIDFENLKFGVLQLFNER